MKSTAVARVHAAPLAALTRDADTLPDVFRLAEMLVPTGMLPDTIRTAGQCVAIILAGRELGMPPMRALRSLVLVKGKVVESADSQLSRFKTDGGRAQFKTLDETKAVLWLRHPNGDEHTETFTIDDAKRAGLAGKGTWQQFPKAMLRSRVITSALKSIGWEGGAGAYDPDEAAAFSPTPVNEGSAVAPTTGGVELRETMPLAEALAFVMPIGQNEGKALCTLPTLVLRRALEWTWDHPEHEKLNEALSVMIMEREQSEAKGEQSGDVGPSQSASGEVTPPPASSGPASASEEDVAKMNTAALQAEALRSLQHPCMGSEFIAGTRAQITPDIKHVELQKLVRQLRAMIAAAPAPRKKGERHSHTVGELPGGA